MQRSGVDAATVAQLAAETPRDEIKQRQGPGGRMLDYVDARFVMDRLDGTVGPENWQDQYVDLAGSVRGGIGILIDGEWVWKWDVGDPSDIEPEKGAYSGAFKRAGVKWGIGRDLYGHKGTRPTTHGGVGSSPAAAPVGQAAAGRGAPRPAASTVPPEPDGFMPVSAVEQARAASPAEAGDEGTCPRHNKAWRENSRGFYCATKEADGSWCGEQPTQRWKSGRGAVVAGR